MKQIPSLILFLALLGAIFLGGTLQATNPIFAQAGPEFVHLKAAFWRSGQLPAVAPDPMSLRQRGQPLLPEASLYTNPNDPDYWTVIAFQGYQSGYWYIYAMRGSVDVGPWRVTDVASSQPSLMSQAERVAYTSKYEGAYHIYTNDLGGYDQRRLTADRFPDAYPDWSPDDTLLAFSRGEDFEQWEIYRMTADGQHQTRLTHSSEDDVTPDWSPDGSRIVWARRSGDSAAIWVMNGDGSGQHPISDSLKYLQNVRWSPDGRRIAFDYDADDDGLNELATINPDGSGLRVIYDANVPMVDVWMGAWSWKGDEVLFTAVKYVVQDGRLYISDSNLARLNLSNGQVRMYDLPGIEIRPDWQPLDRLAPETEMDPLPDWGPGPFTVSWHGQDRGPSGIRGFDVQVKEAGDATWTDWVTDEYLLQKSYPGVGGHTYLFRVRARDRAGNVEPWPAGYDTGTTVENLPPVTFFKPLRPYERYVPWVTWCGYDPGDSGIGIVQTQVREGKDGQWQDWYTVHQPSHQCGGSGWRGETGKTYYFRTRGVDNAQNQEAWPEGDGDTWTTLYGWMIDGHVFDSRGRAVTGMTAVTTPEGFENRPSDRTGAYAVYGHKDVYDFTVQWQRPGFGDLPVMVYAADKDVHQDILLPPADDVIVNGGFESGDFSPGWTPSITGTLVTSDVVHTGYYAVAMTCPQPHVFAPVDTIPDFPAGNRVFEQQLDVSIDGAGRVHVLFNGWDGAVYALRYTRREPDGSWLPTYTITSTTSYYDAPTEGQLAVDDQGNAAVIWHSFHASMPIMYAQRPVDGSWTQPEAITPRVRTPSARIAMDARGVVHVAWRGQGHNSAYTWQHLTKPFHGGWSGSEWITSSAADYHFWLQVDGRGDAHFVWEDNGGVMWHRLRAADGTWSSPQRIYDWGTNYHPHDQYDMATDDLGGIHFLFIHSGTSSERKMMYVLRQADGVVTTPFRVDFDTSYYWSGYSNRYARLVVGRDGAAHITWGIRNYVGEQDAWLVHRERTPSGQWLDAEKQPMPRDATDIHPVVSDDGALHVMGFFASDSYPLDRLFYLQKRGRDWSHMESMAIPAHSSPAPAFILAGPDNRAHFVWISGVEVDYSHTIYDEQPRGTYGISQQVTVPDAEKRPFVAFLYRMTGALDPRRPGLYLRVEDDEGVTDDVFLTDTNTGEQWQRAALDLTPWAGEQITMTVQLYQPPGALCARALVDEISLGRTAYPALGVHGSPAWAKPGQQVQQTITYANMGSEAVASNVVVSLTLPAGLSLLAADPPPDSQEGARALWRLGHLPEGSVGTIRLTLGIGADVPSPAVLHSVVIIAADETELDLLNNRAILATHTGDAFEFLPLLFRK